MRTAGGIWLVSGSLAWGCAGPHLDLPEPPGTAVSVDFEPAAGDGLVAPLFFVVELLGQLAHLLVKGGV